MSSYQLEQGVDSARARAQWATAFLILMIFLTAVQIAWMMFGMTLISDLVRLGGWTTWWLVVNSLLSVVSALGVLLTAPFVIAAQRALTRNLTTAGVEQLQPGVSWGSWAWFVPVANLVVPFKAFRQLAAAAAEDRRPALRTALQWWWAAWLIANVGSSFLEAFMENSSTPHSWLLLAVLLCVLLGLFMVAAWLLAAILRTMVRDQRELCGQLGDTVGWNSLRSVHELGRLRAEGVSGDPPGPTRPTAPPSRSHPPLAASADSQPPSRRMDDPWSAPTE